MLLEVRKVILFGEVYYWKESEEFWGDDRVLFLDLGLIWACTVCKNSSSSIVKILTF